MSPGTHRPFSPDRAAAQLSDTNHAQVFSQLGWAAEELGYPARP
jgi:hypothetical protein